MNVESGRRSLRLALAQPAPDSMHADGAPEVRGGVLTLRYAWPDRNCAEAFAALQAGRPELVLSAFSRLRLAWLGLIEENKREQRASVPGWREQVRLIHARYFEDTGGTGAPTPRRRA